ncbi:DedA family protein [Peteryoungia desertarenae]|uniref:DedA family protein n=1 Tax=Peteryoungia desertarenae TaxID=1813451 RepID=A0ABX6QS87_9HYPH|nr:DedA family protein [Peteryoungia desertarenae]QLF71137.1 DedA family protein [Peteryoungia desertarenae]
MSEALLEIIPAYGLPMLALLTALSCLGLPFPVSFAMMLMGSLAAAGDFDVTLVFMTAFLAALLGDQIGFAVGRYGGTRVIARITRTPQRKAMLAQAEARMAATGMTAVFFTRWLLSPIGPYVNIIAGATRFPWARFSLASFAGELIWTGGYTGLGVVFADNIVAIAEFASDLSGLLVSAVVALALGWRILQILRHSRSDNHEA